MFNGHGNQDRLLSACLEKSEPLTGKTAGGLLNTHARHWACQWTYKRYTKDRLFNSSSAHFLNTINASFVCETPSLNYMQRNSGNELLQNLLSVDLFLLHYMAFRTSQAHHQSSTISVQYANVGQSWKPKRLNIWQYLSACQYFVRDLTFSCRIPHV